ncbi:MAG: hypothetical protein Q8P80_04275 [Candidatus Levybacteria bacterium]|nr:hypothetical protein [Candidatus Levybacteria bacterium]
MITIIHGDDNAASRKYFIDEKNNTKDAHFLDGEKTGLTELVQVFEGGMLFSQEKNIFIESFFAKKALELKEILKLIEENSKNSNIYFWEGKELAKKELSFFKNPVIKLFKYPQSIFLFLDSIKPDNVNNLVPLFHKTLENMEVEIVFFMMIRQFRLLLALSDSQGERIDELKRLAPWQMEKLKRQSKLFSADKLKTIYKKLGEIDLGQKTGGLNLTLEQTIDMLLVNL